MDISLYKCVLPDFSPQVIHLTTDEHKVNINFRLSLTHVTPQVNNGCIIMSQFSTAKDIQL